MGSVDFLSMPMSEPLIQFHPVELPEQAQVARDEVRKFLAGERDAGRFVPGELGRHDPEFSRRCGAEGFIGMTWPKVFGGHERTFLERYVVSEEMLAAGAPVWAHWVADRQSGPVLLRYGHESVRAEILPKIVRGECYFCIGMSEPDSGSDLFSLKSKATAAADGWLINGRKLWTSNAHRSDYMIALLRTSPPAENNRRHGLTQFLVNMDAPGIDVRPIENLSGVADFNEVTFNNVFVPGTHLIGEVDQAWKQATGELAFERSGPERFLETIFVLYELIRAAGEHPDVRLAEGIGRLTAELCTLRQLSLSVAGMLQEGHVPEVEAALVKELGTDWEQLLPARARELLPVRHAGPNSAFEETLRHATLMAPKLTIQGGTREILKGIIARGLGLR